MLSNTPCLQDFFDFTRTSSPSHHHTLATSSPSLLSLDSNHIIIITSLHKFSTILLLLIFSWRNTNSQLNSILCLFCTFNEVAEICSRIKFKNKQTNCITMMPGFTCNFWPQTWGGSSAQPANYSISQFTHLPGRTISYLSPHIFSIPTLTLNCLAWFFSLRRISSLSYRSSVIQGPPSLNQGPFSCL